MKQKHIEMRVRQCLELAKVSNCPRKKFGALILDPIRNVILMDGYNGGPRGGGELCGGDVCLRTEQGLDSGRNVEIGCHHAEMNAICNAAAAGVLTDGASMIVNGEPCLMCAKLIHHAGIKELMVVEGGWGRVEGLGYLIDHGVGVEILRFEEKEK